MQPAFQDRPGIPLQTGLDARGGAGKAKVTSGDKPF
jgi:hypothetical protein